MKKIVGVCLFLSVAIGTFAATLHVGSGRTYPNLAAAVAAVRPGDTILMHAGTYPGGLNISNLKGEPDRWITIRNAPGETVIFEGGSNAIQFVEPEYLHLIGLIFQHQTGNGVNTDDGGTYDTPAHHVIFERCVFRDMTASGNNDLLKLSGLDHFSVINCEFRNGSAGGSGIDMVGCHLGVITGNYFENMGSNAIQCKGGSEHVRIEGNFFRNGGQRTLNLGGSTGLAFFRPDTAHFEAANIQVFSNIFIGSEAPVAYVGSVGVDVSNNTIYHPGRWVVRILQETVDPSRFLSCGDNFFRNNIVVVNNNLSTATNVGPNTRPQSFVYSNNLWYHSDNSNWGGPSLPVSETNQILNRNPLFINVAADNYSIPPNSPAAGKGLRLSEPTRDFLLRRFANPPSIGAVEANPVSTTEPITAAIRQTRVFPNPAVDEIWVEYELAAAAEMEFEWCDLQGRKIQLLSTRYQLPGAHRLLFPLADTAEGLYFLKISANGKTAGVRAILVAR